MDVDGMTAVAEALQNAALTTLQWVASYWYK